MFYKFRKTTKNNNVAEQKQTNKTAIFAFDSLKFEPYFDFF